MERRCRRFDVVEREVCLEPLREDQPCNEDEQLDQRDIGKPNADRGSDRFRFEARSADAEVAQ
jgi:hypothetical protein